ncbi:hypothetical protein GEMRC1_011823 [Eukaryota sp. GEM-RC1]
MSFKPSSSDTLKDAASAIRHRYEQQHGPVSASSSPIDPSPSNTCLPDPALLKILTEEIGIPQAQAITALTATKNQSVDAALEHIWSQSQPPVEEPIITSPQQQQSYSYPSSIDHALKSGFIEGLGEVSTTPFQKQEENTEEKMEEQPKEEGEQPMEEDEDSFEKRRQATLEKMKQVSELKRQKEKEEQLFAEKNRINEAKSYAQLRRQIKDQERKKDLDEARKEREERRRYLKEMKDKVKMDQEMRKKEHTTTPLEHTTPTQATPPPAPMVTDTCRVQIRYAGKAFRAEFKASDPLSTVRHWAHRETGNNRIKLMNMMPRREVVEDSKTLEELGFTPSVSLNAM